MRIARNDGMAITGTLARPIGDGGAAAGSEKRFADGWCARLAATGEKAIGAAGGEPPRARQAREEVA